jgi:hypothetical protein
VAKAAVRAKAVAKAAAAAVQKAAAANPRAKQCQAAQGLPQSSSSSERLCTS